MALDLVEIKPGVRYPVQFLKTALNKPRHAVRFAALYRLDPVQFGALLRLVLPQYDIVRVLTADAGEHSFQLQDYIVELGYENLLHEGSVALVPEEPEAELLPEFWEEFRVQVVDSVAEAAEAMADVVGAMPGKQGRMQFKSLRKQDRRIKQRLAVHEAGISHGHAPDNIVVFDVSGSMTEPTVRAIVDEVVGLAVTANAWLVVVSDTATWWRPGEYDSNAVLAEAEFSGTHYETLAPLFDGRDWGVVVTVADYDSSWGAKGAIGQCTGKIGLLLDISLVERPTFLAEVLGQLAGEVRPLVVAKASLTHNY